MFYFSKLDNTPFLLKTFNLGLVHKDGKHYHEAKEYYRYILDHDHATQKDRATGYHNIGVCYQEEGNAQLSKEYYEKALFLEQDLLSGKEKEFFLTSYNLSELHFNNKEYFFAETYAVECEKVYPRLTSYPETFDLFPYFQKYIFNRTI